MFNTEILNFAPFCPAQVLRGHMQSIVAVKFIQSRGQLISLSKDKVSRTMLSIVRISRNELMTFLFTGVAYLGHTPSSMSTKIIRDVP